MKDDVLIDKYFSNRLSEDEKLEFEKKYQKDEAFKAIIDFEAYVKKAITLVENDRLKEGFNQLESKITNPKEEKKSKKTFNIKSLTKPLIAAAILFVIGTWSYYQITNQNKLTNLVKSYIVVYPNDFYNFSRGDNQVAQFSEIFKSYESKDFNRVINQIEHLPDTERTASLYFFLAQSYLHIGRQDSAKTVFERVIEANEDYVNPSKWYLALILMEEKQFELARPLLTELKNDGYRTQDVDQLLQYLK